MSLFNFDPKKKSQTCCFPASSSQTVLSKKLQDHSFMDVLQNNENPLVQNPSGYDQINLLQKFHYQPNSNWDYTFGLYYSETSDFARYDRLIRPNTSGDGLRSAEWFYGPQKWFMGNLQIVKKGNNKFWAKKLRLTKFRKKKRNFVMKNLL